VTANDHVFLGIIAVSTLIIAGVQIIILIGWFTIARRINTAISSIEDTAVPLMSRLDAMASEALATLSSVRDQLGRVEHVTSDALFRIDQTMNRVQTYVLTPARQGVALLAGARAVLQVLRKSPFAR
jgi:hypothetical protein